MAATGPTLLIAFDGSEAAAAAVRAAAALFPGARAAVLTAHAAPRISEQAVGVAARMGVDPGHLAALARTAEERAATTAAEGAALARGLDLAAEPETSSGDRASVAILAGARRRDADVIVCGSRGLGGLSRAALGSTSSSLLHHADRPVLVVPEGSRTAAGPLVIGDDGSDGARAAIAVAARLFPGRDAIVVNVWESPIRHTLSGGALLHSPLDDVRELTTELDQGFAEAARETAARGAELAREGGLLAEPRAVESSSTAWRGLLIAGRSADASVIVAGSRGRGGVASALLGSVSAGLVHNAELPVLIACA